MKPKTPWSPAAFLERHSYFILTLIFAGFSALPFYWAASLSIRNPAETFTVTGLAIPFLQYQPTLINWIEELAVGESQRALLNSTIIAVGTAVGVAALGAPAAYALSRFSFRRPANKDFTIWFLSQRVLPPIVTVIPIFMMMQVFNLLDTRLALILVNITFNLPLVVVIMRQAFLDLPVELEEDSDTMVQALQGNWIDCRDTRTTYEVRNLEILRRKPGCERQPFSRCTAKMATSMVIINGTAITRTRKPNNSARAPSASV
jgi:multiple sugar transport system permease protein